MYNMGLLSIEIEHEKVIIIIIYSGISGMYFAVGATNED